MNAAALTRLFKSSCDSMSETFTSHKLQNWFGLKAISQHGLVPQSLSFVKYIPGSPAPEASTRFHNSKKNPFVPIGCVITGAVLLNGLMAMRKNDKVKSQRMMRYRVAAQGMTLIAVIGGTLLTQFVFGD